MDDVPGLHHLEIWVADLAAARHDWGWLLEQVGLERTHRWGDDVRGGESWAAPAAGIEQSATLPYLTLTTSPNLSSGDHDRRRPGLNHLALLGGSPERVDAVVADAPSHGWRPLYAERYPHAGGPDHYAGWLANAAGFKVEVVAER